MKAASRWIGTLQDASRFFRHFGLLAELLVKPSGKLVFVEGAAGAQQPQGLRFGLFCQGLGEELWRIAAACCSAALWIS
jgi:hypothetical protein